MPVIADRSATDRNYDSSVLPIGWLGKKSSFERVLPDASFIDALFELVETPVGLMRGHEVCPFCPVTGDSYHGTPLHTYRNSRGEVIQTTQLRLEHRGKQIWVGRGHIVVPSAGGRYYIAPTLIVHYVRDHQYAPPHDFADAVVKFAQLSDRPVLPDFVEHIYPV